MTSHTLTFRGIVYLCVSALMLSWGRVHGEGETDSGQMVPIEALIERFNRIEEKGAAHDKANSISDNWGEYSACACQIVNAMGRRGDRAALPFLEEKGLSTNITSLVRSRAASAYVKIADLSEAVIYLQKYCADPTVEKGKWLLVQQYLDKYEEQREAGVSQDVERHVDTALLAILQTTDVRDVANRINQHLLRHVPQYTDSVQRASLTRFATTGNAWVTNTFHPVKAHFDKIPPSKRVDLRERFPDLPPLPADRVGRPSSVPVWIGVGVAVVIGVAALLRFLLWKRRATP